MKKLILFLLIISSVTITLDAQNLTTDKAGTAISFKIKNLGFNVDGSFSDFKVDANFEADNLPNSYFVGTAVIKSIDTGIEGRNNHLQAEEYFHSEQYPEIKLASDKLKKTGTNQYEFTGKLTIKGKTKSLTFPITLEKSGQSILVKGNFEINRLDFEVGESSWVLKKKVKVAIAYKGNF